MSRAKPFVSGRSGCDSRSRGTTPSTQPLQREVIRFRRLEGVSVPEAARRLKLSDSNLKMIDLRARARLRELLARTE